MTDWTPLVQILVLVLVAWAGFCIVWHFLTKDKD